MTKVILQVPDISCEHCEKTIMETLQGEPGVHSVQVSIPARTVNLEYDEGKLSLNQISEMLDEEGYPVAGSQVA